MGFYAPYFKKIASHPLIGFVIFLLLVGIIRLENLGLQPLNWDDLNVLAIAQLPLEKMVMVGAVRDYHPLLSWVPLHGWIQLFGLQPPWIQLYAWMWGMLGVAAAYALALEITHAKKTAYTTALLMAFSPLIATYSQHITGYGMYVACVLGSWWCLLRALNTLESRQKNDLFWRCPWVWGYGVLTLVAMQSHAMGVLFVPFQLLYVWMSHRALIVRYRQSVIILAVVLLLPLLPWLWAAMQPWHVGRHSGFQTGHAPVEGWMLLMTPVNLLWLGYDRHQWEGFPQGFLVWLGTMATYSMVLMGWKTMTRQAPQHQWLLLCLGILPVVSLWMAHLLFFDTAAKGIFHFRVLLFTTFALTWMTAVWLASWQRQLLAGFILLALILVQCYFTATQLKPQELWVRYGQWLAHHYQPGDGVFIDPGYYYLSVLWGFNPSQFAMSEAEQTIKPTEGNVFERVNLDTPHWLAITGEKTFKTPQVTETLRHFIRNHRRVWLLVTEDKDVIEPYLRVCGTEFLYPLNGSLDDPEVVGRFSCEMK